MPAGRRGRLATWTVRVVIGAALLIDVPHLVAHSAAVVVSGVAWLAAVAAPYAEPDVETP
jgi:hypothetical protein